MSLLIITVLPVYILTESRFETPKMLSKSSLGIVAAGAGMCFVGYCIYFDKKRRSHPEFRQKLKERKFVVTM